MFIPIGDDNPSARVPWVTYGIVAINVVVFVAVNRFGGLPTNVALEWGFITNHPKWYAFATSVFLHGDFFHILFNMLFLWIFGDNVEDKLGHIVYLLFYLVAGAAACAFYMLFTNFGAGKIPLVGASGAIAGVMGCYMLFFPRANIRYFYWFFFFFMGVVAIQAKWALGLWIAMNLLEWLVLNSQYVNGVAYAAHVGGFAVGVAAAMLAKNWLLKSGRIDRMDQHTGFAPRARSVGAPVGEPSRPISPQTPQPTPPPENRHDPLPPRTESERIQQSYVSPRIQTERDGQGFFGMEEAIAANISSAQMDVAIEKYREYVRMRHAKPLPAWVQIEIAAELYKLKDYEACLEAYRRYLARYPNGADASEAKFRLGIILARYRKEFFRAREYLLQAVVEHPDREIVKFAREELDRIQAKL